MMCRLRAAEIPEQELKQRCAEGTMYADFVPIGHWVGKELGCRVNEAEDVIEPVYEYYKCDQCGSKSNENYLFCPWCGADMRE